MRARFADAGSAVGQPTRMTREKLAPYRRARVQFHDRASDYAVSGRERDMARAAA